MSEKYYPHVDIEFIKENCIASGKLEDNGIITIGSTTTFVKKGTRAIFKRSILVRELEKGQVCLEQATSIAFRFSFISPLLKWLEDNKKWKDGGYIVDKDMQKQIGA